MNGGVPRGGNWGDRRGLDIRLSGKSVPACGRVKNLTGKSLSSYFISSCRN